MISCSAGSAAAGKNPILTVALVAAAFDTLSYRSGHPGQQQGLRFPSAKFERPHSRRLRRVSSFFAEVIQQIHSLRASGVMSCHVASAFGSPLSAASSSSGSA
jgi:hypothetical protein